MDSNQLPKAFVIHIACRMDLHKLIWGKEFNIAMSKGAPPQTGKTSPFLATEQSEELSLSPLHNSTLVERHSQLLNIVNE